MKKNFKLLVLVLLAFFAFSTGITKAYAAGEHEFSLRFYDCGEYDSDEEMCLGPNGDYVTPEISIDHGTVLPGQLIKMAVHYKPGDIPDNMFGVYVIYDIDLVNALHDGNDVLILNQTGTIYDEDNPGPYVPKGDTGKARLRTDWNVLFNDHIPTHTICTTVEDDTINQTKITTEGDLFYVYFTVNPNAEPGSEIVFEYDTNNATMMAHGGTIATSGAVLEVYEEKSDDNTLETLTVKNGSTTYALDPEFVAGSKTNKVFTTYVPANITSVDIAATPHEEHAIVSGIGTKSNLQYGNNSYDISVLSQSGQTEVYTVNVYRLNDDNTLSALSLSNVDFGTFSSDTTSYTATVPYTVDKTNVTATATAGNKATVTGTGNNKALSVGNTDIEVTVSPENCKSEYSSVPGNTCTTKTYTVTVTREAASENADAATLTVDGVSVPGFDKDTLVYTLDDVANNKTSVVIAATSEEEHATITGVGTKNLSVGDNALKVKITAQDGTTSKEYTINIHRKSNDATLSALTVTSDPVGTLSPAFSANTTSYTYNVDADEDSVTVSGTPNHALATVTESQTVNPRTTSSVTLTVTAEDNSTKEYTVTFNVAESSNANLSDLTVDGTTVDGFDKDTTTYNITVPSDKDSVNIGATSEDDRVQSITGTGNTSLDYGDNTIKVTVKAEDGTEKEYTLNITRTKKNITDLSDLKVDGTSVPGFDKDTLEYILEPVGYSKSSVNITYTKLDSDATVTGDGNRNLSVGDNDLKVTVTAQNGTDTREYTISIHRKNNDATLRDLNVSGSKPGTLSPAFNSSTYEYTYSVDADEDSVTVSGIPTDNLATVTGGTTVNPRTTSSVTLLVTAEDGLFTQPYVVTFEVAKSSNNNLSEITIDGEPITGFDPNTTTYDITVPSDKENVVVGATAQDDRSDVDGDGTIPLGYGENPVVITVTAEDGTEKEYTINVTREKKHDADLLDLQVDDVSVPGFDKDTLVYDLGEVASNKEGIKLAAILNDSDASVTGDGTKNLLVGDNTFDITVTAQDGTTKKTYTVKVRRLNDSKNLESLTITSDPVGTLEPSFNPGTTTYTYTTDPDETEVIINATVPAGSGSTITEGPGTYNPATTSEVTIVVKAEDNTEKRYVINLVRGESSNNNLSDITIDGTTIDGFNPDVTTYNVTVPSDKATVNIGTTLADDRASVTGDGEKDLTYGDNQIAITVTAEDGTPKVYYVNITRELKNNANLSDLTADDVTVPGFDPETLVYDLGEVASDKTSIKIGATLADTDARVTGTGTFDVAVGNNEYKVTVTAQDTTTKKEYTIKVYKPNNDSSLTGIEVQADTTGTLSPAFDPATTEYTYTSDPDEDEVTIVVTPADGADAVIVGHPDGKVNPADGEDVEVIVTAEDGSITTYTIHVERGLSTNAYLENLEVTGYTISPAFDKDTDHYTLTVDADVDKVTIVATLSDNRATVTGDGEKDLGFGSNPFTITVKAENGDEKPYYLTIERELSDDVKLSDLKVDGDTITGFDPDVSSYDYGTIPNDKTSLEVIGTAEDPNATVTVEGNDNLQVGENTITVTVKAQDGTEGTYTITVTREADSNNDLKSLEVEGYTLDPTFDKDVTNYAIEVPKDVDSIVVNAEPDSDNATVTVEGTDNLQPGENTVTVTVKAEDGTEKVYTITVTKEQEQEEDEKITSQIRTIADGFIKDVVYKSIPEQLKDECDNENWKLHIFADDTEVSEDQKLGTGMVIKLIKDDRVHDSDILVIKGEITGDGLVKVGDVVAVVNNYLDADENPLEGAFFLAADMDDSGTIRVGDVVAIVNIYLED